MSKHHSQNSFFIRAKLPSIPRKWKNKVHDNLYTTRIGEIKPVDWRYLTPSDSFRNNITSYARLAPLQSPIFSRIDLKTRAFAVPLRKLMPDFEDYISSPPSDERQMIHTDIFNIVLAFRTINYICFKPGTLEDFLGYGPVVDNLYNYGLYLNDPSNHSFTSVPNDAVYAFGLDFIIKTFNGQAYPTAEGAAFFGYDLSAFGSDLVAMVNSICYTKVSLMPLLAYHKIYDDWLRDPRLEPDISSQLFDQIDSISTYPSIRYNDTFNVSYDGHTTVHNLLRFLFTERFANYPKDYFNTCGDGAQIGPALQIGAQRLDLYGSVNSYIGGGLPMQTSAGNPTQITSPSGLPIEQKLYNTGYYLGSDGNQQGEFNVGDVWAQVNDADAITPTRLRYQMALQRFLERANIGGANRYNDFVFGEYGIRIPDPYMSRSIFLGGSSVPVVVDEVIAQADSQNSSVSSNVGEFVGRGSVRGRTRGIGGKVKEHCIYMTLQYIVPQQYYWQGIRKDLTRLDNMLFPHYIFQNVGQEPVYKKELFVGSPEDEMFGYNHRYAFEQIALDEIHGNFRSDLSFWRTGRNITHIPHLGNGFIAISPNDASRVFAYSDSRNMPFYIFTRHNFYHKMPLGNNTGDGRIG